MTCKNTAVRVFPLRWPRKRIMRTSSSNYDRYSYADLGKNIQGDRDASDNLNLLSSKLKSTPAGAVEAAIFVQPLCGQSSVACALAADNCFPWCMGVVKGGPRAQNISMFNTARWETHVLLPDVDCGVSRQHSARAVGDCGTDVTGQEEISIVDISTRVGVVRTNCKAEKMCTPSPVPALVSSLVSLSSLQTTNNTELGLVKEHKRNKWLGVRMEQQPFVVAGDVLLSVEAEQKVVIVTRLYDVGHGSLQMSNERLTLSSNAHSIEIVECETQSDKECVETAMSEGKLVLPVAFYTMENGRRPQEHADGGEVPGLLPAAASRWAVHWAANPTLEVYASIFDFCRGVASFNYNVHSSFGSALVWTVHTMRSVDLEGAGSPSTEDIKSRVSYMRVPQFFGDFFESGESSSQATKYCDIVLGLKIVGVEYLNPQNILITVLAARPRDYNPHTGEVFGPRIYRYYYLNPERHDCVVDRETADLSSKSIFSCWKSQEDGMWSGDSMLYSGSSAGGSGASSGLDNNNVPCAEARLVPAFGSAIVMPIVAFVVYGVSYVAGRLVYLM
jgi:hypothetical protein